MEPAMQTSSQFSQSIIRSVNIGPGAGMGLLTVFCCLACALVGVGGCFVPTICDLKDVLPDHDQEEKVEVVPVHSGF